MQQAATSRVQSPPVPRQPSKPVKGEPYRMHLLLPGEVVEDVDDLAARMTRATPGRVVTRTEIVRMAIHAYIAANKAKSSK